MIISLILNIPQKYLDRIQNAKSEADKKTKLEIVRKKIEKTKQDWDSACFPLLLAGVLLHHFVLSRIPWQESGMVADIIYRFPYWCGACGDIDGNAHYRLCIHGTEV